MQVSHHCVKPRPRFYGKASYYLGLELEVEAPDCDARIKGLDICKRPQAFYAKHDGSLAPGVGWELVTHPISPECWLERKPKASGPVAKVLKLIGELKALEYTSYDNGRCGLHVHVSRTAFGPKATTDEGLKCCHYYWFARLVNGKLFRRLSQREDAEIDRWAKQREVSARWLILDQHGYKPMRYVACNVTANTVEVRIFRGNMREDRIRKCVEATVAAVEHAKTMGGARLWERAAGNGLDEMFASWVGRNRTRFPNLFGYLIELGLAKNPNPNKDDAAVPSSPGVLLGPVASVS